MRSIGNKSHKALTGFMALWLSGLLLLFCCEMPKAQAAQPEHCPLGRMQEHCKKAKNAAAPILVTSRSESQEIDCCSFLPALFDKARKVQKNIPLEIAVTAVETYRTPSLRVLPDHPVTAMTYRSLIRPPEKVYIKNCVFRI